MGQGNPNSARQEQVSHPHSPATQSRHHSKYSPSPTVFPTSPSASAPLQTFEIAQLQSPAAPECRCPHTEYQLDAHPNSSTTKSYPLTLYPAPYTSLKN